MSSSFCGFDFSTSSSCCTWGLAIIALKTILFVVCMFLAIPVPLKFRESKLRHAVIDKFLKHVYVICCFLIICPIRGPRE